MKPSVYVKLSVNLNALNELPRDEAGNITLATAEIEAWVKSDSNPVSIISTTYVAADKYYEVPTDWMQIATLQVENVEAIALIRSDAALPIVDMAVVEQLCGRSLAVAHGAEDAGINLDAYSAAALYAGNLPVSGEIAAEYEPTIHAINDTVLLARTVGLALVDTFDQMPGDVRRAEGWSEELKITMRWTYGFFLSVHSVGDQIVPTFDSSAPKFAQWCNYCAEQIRALGDEEARRIA